MSTPVHHTWIDRVRQRARTDGRITAALTYGSFTKGEGDRFSDVAFWLFVHDDAFPAFDSRDWIDAVGPSLAVFDTLPHQLTLAVFPGYLRAEFHFAPAYELPSIRSWVGNGPFPAPEAMALVDRTGDLQGHLQYLHDHPPRHGTRAEVQGLLDGLINWSLQGAQVLERGEYARALTTLGTVHEHLLRLARLVEDTTTHWATPAKALEGELTPEAYGRFVRCTAALDPAALALAYEESWRWGHELAAALEPQCGATWPEGLDVEFTRLAAGR